MRIERKNRAIKVVSVAAVCVIPVLLVTSAIFFADGYAAVSAVIVALMLVPFFLAFEARKPKPRDILPIAVLSAVAAVSRIAFFALPSFKPISAVIMLSGAAFGAVGGFLTGSISALISNMFFGQGAFTPWQMFAWGLMGYITGLLYHRKQGLSRVTLCTLCALLGGAVAAAVCLGVGTDAGSAAVAVVCSGALSCPLGLLLAKFKSTDTVSVCVLGFLLCLLYGFIMNIWHVIGFVSPVTWTAVAAVYAASLPFDLVHAVSTVIFLALIFKPWLGKFDRIRAKYDLGGGGFIPEKSKSNRKKIQKQG